MWQHILKLPLVATAIALLGAVVVAGWAWVKRKALSKISSAATNAAESRGWGWVAKKVYAAAPPPTAATGKPSNERTYRGTFRLYSKAVNYPRDWFFVVEHKGIEHTVTVVTTNCFSLVRSGDFVEIDTLVLGDYYAERVQRVRKVERKD